MRAWAHTKPSTPILRSIPACKQGTTTHHHTTTMTTIAAPTCERTDIRCGRATSAIERVTRSLCTVLRRTAARARGLLAAQLQRPKARVCHDRASDLLELCCLRDERPAALVGRALVRRMGGQSACVCGFSDGRYSYVCGIKVCASRQANTVPPCVWEVSRQANLTGRCGNR